MKSLWSEEEAASFVGRYGPRWGEPLALRIYSSRLLGSDPSLVLHGGGNTSLKATRADIHGDPLKALFVKASGGNLAAIEPEEFPGLDLSRLEKLRRVRTLSDSEMTSQLRIGLLDGSSPTPSLETLAHAFIPEIFIDHTHADAVLALTNQEGGEAMVKEAFGEDVLVLPYIHPGFELALAAATAYESAPRSRGMIWMYHGLVSWGPSARDAYETTIDLVSRAERSLASRTVRISALSAPTPLPDADARLVKAAPVLRGLLARPTGNPDRPHARVVLAALTDREALDFLDAKGAAGIAATAPLTTDHLIRTKPFPLWIDRPDYEDGNRLRSQLLRAVEAYGVQYSAYVDRHASELPPGMERFDAFPRVLLLPGLGVVCAGPTLEDARIARDITVHTLRVKARIASMGRVSGLPESDLFRMEYRPQQHEKLRGGSGERDEGRASRLLEGQIALVTGAAGAIGSGICRELLEQGALVAATDLAGDSLDGLVSELAPRFPERILGVALDVSSPGSVHEGFDSVIRNWGGVDLLVINAGIAQASALVELDLDEFRRLERVNVEGTLLLLAEAARHFALQGTGGDVVLISSKTVFSPGAGFGAYSATKAAAHQLARIASLEMAPLDVRVNMVAPDAVFSDGERKSGLWAVVGPGRMRARGLDAAGLEEFYRDRNLLKARITAGHVARAVLFFATRQAPITGATLPVDGGLPDATPR